MNTFGFIVLLAVIGTIAAETPLQYRQNSRRLSARQEAAPYQASGWKPAGARLELPSEVTTTDYPTTTTELNEEATTEQSGPYQYSGWAPTGARLELSVNVGQSSEQQPSQVYGAPQQVYGPPAQQYGPPAQKYGPPQETDQSSAELPEEASGDGSENRSSTGNPDAEELEVNEEGQESKSQNENRANELEQLEPVDEAAPLQPGQGAYFIQLADGSLQRIVYLPPDQIIQSAPQIAQPVKLINPIVVPQYVQYNAQYQTGW